MPTEHCCFGVRSFALALVTVMEREQLPNKSFSAACTQGISTDDGIHDT
jgi:hypothetical protein